MPTPQGHTLADAYAALVAQMGNCKVTRAGSGGMRFFAKGDRGSMEMDITLADTPDLGPVAVVEGLTLESSRNEYPKSYSGPETMAMLLEFIKENTQHQRAQAEVKLKEDMTALKDADARLARRGPNGGIAIDDEGRTLADAYKCLGWITPKLTPTMERDGEKVLIARKSDKTTMVAEFAIADGAGGQKAAAIESFVIQSGGESPQRYTGEDAANVVFSLIAKMQEAEFNDRLLNGGLSDPNW